MKSHKDLNAWKESMKLAKEAYRITNGFPKFELYGLTSQIRRAAVSVPSNISEGAARNQKRDFIRFLQISLGSLAELETQCILAHELDYIDSTNLNLILNKSNLIRAQLTGLIKSLKGSLPT